MLLTRLDRALCRTAHTTPKWIHCVQWKLVPQTTSISWVISTFREHFNRSAFLGELEWHIYTHTPYYLRPWQSGTYCSQSVACAILFNAVSMLAWTITWLWQQRSLLHIWFPSSIEPIYPCGHNHQHHAIILFLMNLQGSSIRNIKCGKPVRGSKLSTMLAILPRSASSW